MVVHILHMTHFIICRGKILKHWYRRFFKKQGYSVTERGGADGGVDILLKKNVKKLIVQCKYWKTSKVGVKIVREQFGKMKAEEADEAIIVTSGHFSCEALAFAKNKNITLISGNRLKEIINEGKKVHLDSEKNKNLSVPPNCPLCSSIMVERTAQKGRWAGNKFWGSPNFPKCTGIVKK